MPHTDPDSTDRTSAGLRSAAAAWDHAMLSNDAEAIGRFMAANWRIIGADGGITDRVSFLAQIRDGRLSHDTMTTEDADVELIGSVGILVAKGVSAGQFEGRSFRAVERQSNVYVYEADRWLCVLTQLSPLSPAHQT